MCFEEEIIYFHVQFVDNGQLTDELKQCPSILKCTCIMQADARSWAPACMLPCLSGTKSLTAMIKSTHIPILNLSPLRKLTSSIGIMVR